MTCIVAVKGDKKIVFGSDRMVSSYSSKDKLNHPKIFKIDNMVFGGCGCPGFLNAIKHKFKPPKYRPSEQTIEKYIYVSFVDAMKKFTKKEELDGESSSFLFVVAKRIYQYWDGIVYEYESNFYTDGSGCSLAKGAIFAAIEMGRKDPRKIAEIGLMAAEKYVPSCDGNFDFIEVEL